MHKDVQELNLLLKKKENILMKSHQIEKKINITKNFLEKSKKSISFVKDLNQSAAKNDENGSNYSG
jgi:hypothetical protein